MALFEKWPGSAFLAYSGRIYKKLGLLGRQTFLTARRAKAQTFYTLQFSTIIAIKFSKSQ